MSYAFGVMSHDVDPAGPLIPTPRRPRVLIVEDESRLRELLLDVIPSMHFPADAVRSAEDARRLMEADPREIVLLDLQLPVMSGLEFFQIIRQRWPETQVIILTGFGDLEAAQTAIRLDVVDFLSKPCHLAELEQALDRARRRLHGAGDVGIEAPAPAAGESHGSSTLADTEREQILAALARNGGNRTATAAELGISRRTLHYRLNEYREQGHKFE